MILIAGGLFLVWKATTEIHHSMDPEPEEKASAGNTVAIGFAAAIGQILLLDLVFSIDSIITAVGMTQHLPIMIIAVVTSVIVMLVAAEPLAKFINDNPTVVMLALGFLIMIGMTLIAEGFGAHVPKGYVYAAMAFSAAIECRVEHRTTQPSQAFARCPPVIAATRKPAVARKRPAGFLSVWVDSPTCYFEVHHEPAADSPYPVQPRRGLRLQDFAPGIGSDPRRQRRAEPRPQPVGWATPRGTMRRCMPSTTSAVWSPPRTSSCRLSMIPSTSAA